MPARSQLFSMAGAKLTWWRTAAASIPQQQCSRGSHAGGSRDMHMYHPGCLSSSRDTPCMYMHQPQLEGLSWHWLTGHSSSSSSSREAPLCGKTSPNTCTLLQG